MKFFDYLGFWGVLLLPALGTAIWLLVRSVRDPARSRTLGRAFVAAALAYLLAQGLWGYATSLVSDVQEDQEAARARLEEQEARRAAESGEAPRPRMADYINFAEEGEDDRRDVAGQKTEAQLQREREAVLATNKYAFGAPAPPTDFRAAGKVARDAGKRVETDAVIGVVRQEVDAEVGGKILPEGDVIAATRWARRLLVLTDLVLWVAIACGLFDYLARFNRTFDYFLPLPLSLLGVDRLLRKTRTVHVRCRAGEQAAAYLASVVQRGETFLYFGERDPLPEGPVPRLPFGDLRGLPLRKEVVAAGAKPVPAEYLFEAAWFGRAAVVVVGRELCAAAAVDVAQRLASRFGPRAAAFRTVHLVWDHEAPPPGDVLPEWLRCAPPANIKLVLFTPAPLQGAFEETLERVPAPSPYPALWDHVQRGPAPDAILYYARLGLALGLARAKVWWNRAVRHPRVQALSARAVRLWVRLRCMPWFVQTGAWCRQKWDGWHADRRAWLSVELAARRRAAAAPAHRLPEDLARPTEAAGRTAGPTGSHAVDP